MEILRIKDINTIKKEIQQAEKNLKETKNKIKSMKYKAKKTIKEISNLNDEVKSSRKEYITILGIFASIILAFVAGLTFTNSVLSNINNGSIYRLLFITSLIGLFITNMLHHLYKFIKNINRSDNKQENFDWTIIIFNTIVVVIMLCIFLTWLCNRALNI